MAARKKASKIKKILRSILIIFLVLSLLLYAYFEFQAQPQILMLVQNRARVLAETVINEAVQTVLSQHDYKYDDLVTISRSDDGRVQSVSTNSMVMNTIKTQIDLEAQRILAQTHIVQVEIPLGSFSGLIFVSEAGPVFTFNIELTGTFDSRFKSSFSSAGVNQTAHHIELVVHSNMMVSSPLNDDDVNFETNFDIAQTVIVGSTPSAFANLDKS